MRYVASSVLTPLLILGLATAATADDFYPISAVSASTSATDLWPASNLIQGPGVGIDANEPHDKILGGAEGNWVTAAPGGFPTDYIAVAGMPIIELDLGQDRDLSEISVWGYASTNANGLSEFSLRFATEADGPAGFGTSISFNPSYAGLPNDDTIRQSFSLGQTVSARYVELTAVDNHFIAPGDGSGGETPGGDRVGIGEIAFAVPEPTSLLLLFGATCLLGMFIRRL